MQSHLKTVFLADEQATIALGEKIGRNLQNGMLVDVQGELGAGKTTLIKGIVKALGGDPELVQSPTFSVVNEYKIADRTILHCDFYRIGPENELEDFGGTEFFYQNRIFLIEWFSALSKSLREQISQTFQVYILKLTMEGDGRSCKILENWSEK